MVLVINIVGDELAGHDITGDVSLDGASRVTRILHALVVVAGPEEGHGAVWHKLTHHVECGISSLIKRNVPMLSPGALTIDPLGVRCDITGCIDVGVVRLQEWVDRDTTVTLKLDSGVGQELSDWGHTLTEDNQVDVDFLA